MSTLNVKDSSGNWKEIPSIGGYTKDEVNTMIAGKANEVHTHTFSQITDISKSMATNGYIKLGSGLIIQWGSFAGTTDGWNSCSFPYAFPNACFGVWTNISYDVTSSSNAWGYIRHGTLTNTGFQATLFKAPYINYWIALGY